MAIFSFKMAFASALILILVACVSQPVNASHDSGILVVAPKETRFVPPPTAVTMHTEPIKQKIDKAPSVSTSQAVVARSKKEKPILVTKDPIIVQSEQKKTGEPLQVAVAAPLPEPTEVQDLASISQTTPSQAAQEPVKGESAVDKVEQTRGLPGNDTCSRSEVDGCGLPRISQTTPSRAWQESVKCESAQILSGDGVLKHSEVDKVEQTRILPAIDTRSRSEFEKCGLAPISAMNEAKEDLSISGSMTMDFASRQPGADPMRVRDRYEVDISVEQIFRLAGLIHRSSRVLSKILGREKQPLQLSYGLTFWDFEIPNRPKSRLGALQGVVPVSRAGDYRLGEHGGLSLSANSPVRVPILFTGKMSGRPEDRSGAVRSIVREYTRLMGGRKVTVKSKKVDPLNFNDIVMAPGPGVAYPEVKVSGNLDFDYETGNWMTTGIEFSYQYEGKVLRDKVTGSIKWVEDSDRQTNGRGKYEFNLRFNESLAGGTEEAFFGSLPDEEAFFSVDAKAPHMGGVITYQDQFLPVTEGATDEKVVISSVANYNLKAHLLTKQQVVNFIKLWMLIVGPMNDE